MDKKVTQQSKNKFVINEDATPLSANDICEVCYGMSFSEFVKDVKRNIGGKYDHLYSQPKEATTHEAPP